MWCANVTANIAVADGLPLAALLSTANSIEIVVSLILIRKFCGPRPDLAAIKDVAPIMLVIGLAVPLCSALIASVALGTGPSFAESPNFHGFASDALSLLVLIASLLIFRDAIANRHRPSIRDLIEWAALTGIGKATTYAVFSQTSYPLVIAMLEELDQEVSVAHDGNEAITSALNAAEQGSSFDLVRMPGCDNYAATKAIRRGGILSDELPIVALTANAFSGRYRLGPRRGLQGNLAKPLHFDAPAATLAGRFPVQMSVKTWTRAAGAQPIARTLLEPSTSSQTPGACSEKANSAIAPPPSNGLSTRRSATTSGANSRKICWKRHD